MMLIANGEKIESLGNFFYCDNDFLSLLSSNEQFLEEALKLFPSKMLIDPLTEIEFLRGVFTPKQRTLKERMIETAFIRTENNQEILVKTLESALELSRLYAHQNKGTGASLVDLLLAGRIMNTGSTVHLVTGNAKDFPSIIFDTLTVINFEQNDGSMRAISVLAFNRKKYNECKLRYSRMEEAAER